MKELIELKEPKNKVLNAIDVFDRIKKINIDYTQENMLLITLNTNNQIINVHNIFKGGLNECTIDPKTLFYKVIQDNARGFIIAHNHPSGYLKPSSQDLAVTKRLMECAKILNLRLMDHVIFNKKEYYKIEIV